MDVLRRGSEGNDVRVWQEFLSRKEFLAPNTANGIFGPKTEAATKAFQTRFGLTVDGIVGKNTVAQAIELGFMIPATDFASLVAVPANVNQGLTMVSQQTMLGVLGAPGVLTASCSRVTNGRLADLLVTQDVGPFVVTGLKPAVDLLRDLFSAVKVEEPELFNSIGTAGMLCCRGIRLPGGGVGATFSNHSWGTAIDINMNGALDKVADGKAQRGLVKLHPFFKSRKFFWGAGFGPTFEDAMHFEASEELIQEWKQQGVFA